MRSVGSVATSRGFSRGRWLKGHTMPWLYDNTRLCIRGVYSSDKSLLLLLHADLWCLVGGGGGGGGELHKPSG